uniref:Putative secreted protein n=1 Tax=Anopheles darlingi TaxID=43151 RepID=A0A2M4DN54_ANODA
MAQTIILLAVVMVFMRLSTTTSKSQSDHAKMKLLEIAQPPPLLAPECAPTRSEVDPFAVFKCASSTVRDTNVDCTNGGQR